MKRVIITPKTGHSISIPLQHGWALRLVADIQAGKKGEWLSRYEECPPSPPHNEEYLKLAFEAGEPHLAFNEESARRVCTILEKENIPTEVIEIGHP